MEELEESEKGTDISFTMIRYAYLPPITITKVPSDVSTESRSEEADTKNSINQDCDPKHLPCQTLEHTHSNA